MFSRNQSCAFTGTSGVNGGLRICDSQSQMRVSVCRCTTPHVLSCCQSIAWRAVEMGLATKCYKRTLSAHCLEACLSHALHAVQPCLMGTAALRLRST